MKGVRLAVGALTMSLAGFAAWMASEGTGPTFTSGGTVYHKPYVPTQGDVPTIGFGSTYYEDGRRVTMADPPISRARAVQLAKNLNLWEEKRFAASLPGVWLNQTEYDLYMDFVGQYGLPNWSKPKSPRTWLLRGEYVNACAALLSWRFQAKRDCSNSVNWGRNGCKGVWTRQLERHRKCMESQ
jgi:lysozyme